MSKPQEIELLAPAKNLLQGKTAINYGADAVYIGADRFGARAAAGNSVSDIKELTEYAHLYGAKVFVTLNTILYDHELKDAEELIHQIYDAGVDALIIQDMSILKMDIPPIALHASTQTHNFELDKIQFLDQLDLERIVLARELSIKEIKEISAHTKAELEYFIHGALCVSLSGQCYFSQAITGRSANRGECAQMCRHPYNLMDSNGKTLVLNKHLLSLKDLNNSHNLDQLIDAGIKSFKIEGRLKDEGYVKNVVSYYRQLLDQHIYNSQKLSKASSGSTQISFVPDPERSFNRQSIDYFATERKQGMINPYSPKSMGKRVGKITFIGKGFIEIKSEEPLHNGDGLCFIQKDVLKGIRVEKVLGNKIFVNETSGLKKGLEVYRNHDHDFTKTLENDKSTRKIKSQISISEVDGHLIFEIIDEDQLTSEFKLACPELANNAERAFDSIQKQMKRSGDSVFTVDNVDINFSTAYFFRFSELNDIRRALFELHIKKRIQHFKPKDRIRKNSDAIFPKQELDFSGNIANQQAAQFYVDHGVPKQDKALEISSPLRDQLLMTTRYCIKYELGFCERFQKVKNDFQEPLFLQDTNRKYRLEFDCKNCLMKIKLHSKNQ
jgi:putative protease